MPRLKHQPPRYSRHKSTGQAVVSFHGKRLYLGPYGSAESRRRYQDLLAEWQPPDEPANSPPATQSNLTRPTVTAATLHDIKQASNDVTVIELIVAYRAYATGYYQKQGVITREVGMIDDACRILRGWLNARTDTKGRPVPTMLADDFGPIALEAVREAMIDLGWRRLTINKQIARIVRMFKWGVSKEIVEPRTLQRLQALRGLSRGRSAAKESKPVLPVSDSAVAATIERLPLTVAAMVQFQLLTGARPGEVCNLRPSDVIRDADVWRCTLTDHKTRHQGRDRVIFIGPQAQVILAPFLLRDQQAYCFDPRDTDRQRRESQREARRTPLSCGNRAGTNRKPFPKRRPGVKYDASSYRHAIHRACDAAEIARWSPNQLRHAAATKIRATYGLEAAQVVLGHSAADVTQIYAERDLQLAARVAAEVG